ncbi:MAG: hypothetical protein AAF579_08845 [Cyanobacteria bacterium P01_C01_bin.118]
MCFVTALSLQVLLFIHLILLFQYEMSLRGEGLEVLLLITTIAISVKVIFYSRVEQSSRWIKNLYLLNCFGQLPIWLSATVMVLFIYVTDTIGAFQSPSGTYIVLKSQSGLLGCSVHPYIVQGLFEQRLYQEDYVSCFNFLDTKIAKTTWNSDETNLTVSVEATGEDEYTFNLTPINFPNQQP